MPTRNFLNFFFLQNGFGGLIVTSKRYITNRIKKRKLKKLKKLVIIQKALFIYQNLTLNPTTFPAASSAT